ncbi:unnamed protein product [Dibothriocephalus latus]|uniref:Uncharacterized protein n=1 Tax=Dibothriocephalus latus TaxID=60516 RepID=A0A3P7S4R7_DIBLA|nr:unnamed protein product [Dibothriocephalus latus]
MDAFAEHILNAPGCQQGSLVASPSQPSVKDEVVCCMVREEGDVFVAQMGSSEESSVCVLRNDNLLPNFRTRGHPSMKSPWLTRKPLRSRRLATTIRPTVI